MHLTGNANWWLPRRLDRLIPHLNVEGAHHPAPAPAPARARTAGATVPGSRD
jgi:RND superfamily putative drug exporter